MVISSLLQNNYSFIITILVCIDFTAYNFEHLKLKVEVLYNPKKVDNPKKIATVSTSHLKTNNVK